MQRHRLKSVIAVVLVWQLTAALLLAGPATASAHAGVAPSAGAAHCHAHGAAGTATVPASGSDSSARTHHSSAPDCCQDTHACNSVCAQDAAAIPQMLATTPVLTDHSAEPDLRSPPLVRRTAEVFRPPI
jgi:hypothetical protein